MENDQNENNNPITEKNLDINIDNNVQGNVNSYGYCKEDVESINQIEYILRNKCHKPKICNSEYIEIEFSANRRALYCNSSKLELALSDDVIVEEETGEDYGTVYTLGKLAKNKACRCNVDEMPVFSIIRKANSIDKSIHGQNIMEGKDIMLFTQSLSEQYNLEIKVTGAEWQFNRQRLTIFFTAQQRVDFRELVKELAKKYRTRIELRQISTREEAKRLGTSIGPCGREMCCTTFLHNFEHVTLEHAKKQQLSNNISKLSGNCVRLKCCLKYEYSTYFDAFEKYPPLHSVVETEKGIAKILKVDIFKDITTLYYDEDREYTHISFEELNKYITTGKVYINKNSDLPTVPPIVNLLNNLPDDDIIPAGFFEEDLLIEQAKQKSNHHGESREHNGKNHSKNNGQNGHQQNYIKKPNHNNSNSHPAEKNTNNNKNGNGAKWNGNKSNGSKPNSYKTDSTVNNHNNNKEQSKNGK
ncbi:MAG: regulatory iron-sulfur-containing complex subunit RicT [bacterium]